MQILSGLVVSVDAFFIGLSLGVQKECKFLHLVIINVFLFWLCLLGYFVAGQVYEIIPFEPDILVGTAFISLGLWSIFRKNESPKSIALVGMVMSIEAMLITMGITIVFLSNSTIFIPLAVAFAHFAYSALTFSLARVGRVKNIPSKTSRIVSGCALIVYGIMAFLVDFGI